MEGQKNNEVRSTQKSLSNFLAEGLTMHQTHDKIHNQLLQGGAIQLSEKDRWDLEPGNTYFISRGQSAIIAFRMGNDSPESSGFRVAAAHTDSPLLKAKSRGVSKENGVLAITTELYGGPIISTWLDRELMLAGSAVIQAGEKTQLRSFVTQGPIAQIPNLAIHLNREVNKGFEYNPQTHLRALLLADIPEAYIDSALEYLIAQSLSVKPEQVIGGDWYLVPHQQPVIYADKLYSLSSGRIDNLAGCHAVLRSFLSSTPIPSTQIAVFYNHEEIGSASFTGANSRFFLSTLKRIVYFYSSNLDAEYIALAKSFQISVDAAHAMHPNFSEKFDHSYPVHIGAGPVIKLSANQRYATNPETQMIFMNLCKSEGIITQTMVNRSDIPSGSTIGPISVTRTDIPTIDIGIPIHAMHSVREIASAHDQNSLIQILTQFYQSITL